MVRTPAILLAAVLLIGAVRPVPGEVLRPFERPAGPYAAGHRGVDLAASPGQPVRSVLAGHVAFAGDVAGTGWVTIAHGGGLRTTYGDVDPAVRPGEWLRAGDVVGTLARAPHLDWGARLDGGYIDPMSLFRRWKARLASPLTLPAGDPVTVPD